MYFPVNNYLFFTIKKAVASSERFKLCISGRQRLLPPLHQSMRIMLRTAFFSPGVATIYLGIRRETAPIEVKPSPTK
jgi:hypothetical protein